MTEEQQRKIGEAFHEITRNSIIMMKTGNAIVDLEHGNPIELNCLWDINGLSGLIVDALVPVLREANIAAAMKLQSMEMPT